MKDTSFFNESAIRGATERVLGAYHAKGFFPSAAVRVFSSDRTICTASIGGAQDDTVFDVASLTKIATTTMVLQLISQGKLALDDSILNLLPSLSRYELLKQRLAGVTIYALLTHTSGIVDWYPFYAEKGNAFEEVLTIALTRYGPVQGMVYSDLNFMLLGKVIEACHGKTLDACLAEHLVMPHGLGRMTYRADPAWDIAPSSYGNPIEEVMCAERGIVFDGWRPHTSIRGEANDGNAYYYFDGVAGSAGIFASPEAYERLCRLYLNTDDETLIVSQREHEPTRGLGWQTGEMYPQGCGHTGFTGTSIYISRELNIGVVAFANRLLMDTPHVGGINEFRAALHKAVVESV